MADRAAYRVVQEALTNATKHAPGAPVTVRLSTDAAAGEAVVAVANAAGLAPRDGGRGLRAGRPRRARPAGRRAAAGGARRRRLRGDRPAAADRRSRDRAPRLQARAGRGPPPGPAQHDRRDLGAGRGLGRPAGADLRLRPLRDRTLRAGPRGLRRNCASASASRLWSHGCRQARRTAASDPPARPPTRRARTIAGSTGPATQSPSPAYRLCFSDGRLVHKDEVPVAET